MNTKLLITATIAMLLLTGCRDYTAEEKIRADAQVGISANQAMAQMRIAENEAEAQKAVAESQKEATVVMSNNVSSAEKYKAEQATKQASIWADKLPFIVSITMFTILVSIVLVYRGKIGLKRVDKEIMLLTTANYPQPNITPPAQVTIEAKKRNALIAPGSTPGVWLLTMQNGKQLTMRPKQLTAKDTTWKS